MQHFGDFADEVDLVFWDVHPLVERADQQRAHVFAGDLRAPARSVAVEGREGVD